MTTTRAMGLQRTDLACVPGWSCAPSAVRVRCPTRSSLPQARAITMSELGAADGPRPLTIRRASLRQVKPEATTTRKRVANDEQTTSIALCRWARHHKRFARQVSGHRGTDLTDDPLHGVWSEEWGRRPRRSCCVKRPTPMRSSAGATRSPRGKRGPVMLPFSHG